MKNDKEIRQEFRSLKEKSFKEIEAVLRRYDYNAQTMLASFVASICDVDIADMLTSSGNTYITQCRALFWYAYRYMTHETHERISERTVLDGCRFTAETVRLSCSKIYTLIEENDMWRGRWLVTKRMIRLWQDPHDYYESDNVNPMPQKYKIFLRVPKNAEVEIKKDKE